MVREKSDSTFTKKYRPHNLSEYVGQTDAVTKFLQWIKNWKHGRAALFFGPPGVGKTALIEAYCEEKGLDLIEMNASDYRSARQIRDVIGHSASQRSLTNRGKFFLIDEIDGLTGEDRGGAGELIAIIGDANFPIVLTANEAYSPKLRALRSHCQLVQFRHLANSDIRTKLSEIAASEKLKMPANMLDGISKISNGDMRAAINDLESFGRVENVTLDAISQIGNRDRLTNIFDVLKIIFKTTSALSAKLSVQNSDKDPEEIFWWIENNIANEYETPEEVARAYNNLSKADLFRKKIQSRQDWRLLSYFIDLMTGGVATSKKTVHKKFTKYQYPANLSVLGRTKLERAEEKAKLVELAKNLHCSTKKIRTDVLPFLKIYQEGHDIV